MVCAAPVSRFTRRIPRAAVEPSLDPSPYPSPDPGPRFPKGLQIRFVAPKAGPGLPEIFVRYLRIAKCRKIAPTHHFGGGTDWSYIHSEAADGLAEGKKDGGPHFSIFLVLRHWPCLGNLPSPPRGQKRNTF